MSRLQILGAELQNIAFPGVLNARMSLKGFTPQLCHTSQRCRFETASFLLRPAHVLLSSILGITTRKNSSYSTFFGEVTVQLEFLSSITSFRDRLACCSHAARNHFLLDASTERDVLRFCKKRTGSIEISLNVLIARPHAGLMENSNDEMFANPHGFPTPVD